MKNILTLIAISLLAHLACGQACGIYRIAYAGSINSPGKEMLTVQLPTTMLLHGVEKENSEKAFVETTVTNEVFNFEISSHLTTPYTDIAPLLSLYKSQSEQFRMKVAYLENGVFHEKTIALAWDDIKVSVVDDMEFGTLFKFSFKEISI